jgi:hypothetical protein
MRISLCGRFGDPASKFDPFTPIFIRTLAMPRAAFASAGPFAKFARRVCGIEAGETITEYKATVDYAKAREADPRRIVIQAAE